MNRKDAIRLPISHYRAIVFALAYVVDQCGAADGMGDINPREAKKAQEALDWFERVFQ